MTGFVWVCEEVKLGELGHVRFSKPIWTFKRLNVTNTIFTHLKLCFAAATHNFKRLQITHICLI